MAQQRAVGEVGCHLLGLGVASVRHVRDEACALGFARRDEAEHHAAEACPIGFGMLCRFADACHDQALIAMDLQKNGWAGIVIFGCVRDTAVLATVLIGIKAIGAHPRKTARQNEGQVGVRLEIGGIVVDTGDDVIADEDGVLLLPAAG